MVLTAVQLLLSAQGLPSEGRSDVRIPDVKFRRLDTRDGLSNSQVNCVYRDSRGYVWMGTAYGLNRYDGYRFKTFYSNRLDTTSMRDNYTTLIMEDFRGKLWLQQGMNYCVYDPQTETFERNAARELSQFLGQHDGVERMYIDSQKNFWVKYYEEGIVYYNVKTKKTTLFKQGYEKNQYKPNYGISTMADYNGSLVVATFNGELICLNGETGNIEWEDTWMHDNGGLPNQDYKLRIDQRGNFWVVSQGYTFIYIRSQKRWYKQLTDLLKAENVEGCPDYLQVWDVQTDPQGLMWVATDHEGVFVVDMKNHKMRQFLNNRYDQSTISDNTAKNIFIDKSGNVWIGTYKNGVCQYINRQTGMRSLEIGDINTVTEDHYGNWWLGSNDSGIIVYNPKTSQTLAQYTAANSNLAGNILVGSCTARDGSIWFGSYNGGLTHCIPQGSNGQATIVNYQATPGGLAINSVWSVTEDKWGRLWMATLGGGIQQLDPKTGKFRTWNTKNSDLPNDYLTSATWIKKGWLMVGTNWYYCFLNPLTGQLANRLIPESPNVTVATPNTVCVMEDSRGLIWQGSASGVCVYDQKSGFVKLLDMTNGFFASSICSVVEDQNHMMWVVTDHGVSKVIPERQKDGTWQFIVSSYNARDGLQQGTYNQRSAFVTRDGMILIGGQGGLDIINTKALSNEKSKERPVFSGLQIFDVDVPVSREFNGRVILDEALDVCRSVTLKFGEQFTIQLASDAGIAKNWKRFVYRLEGFNDNWVKTSEQNPNITYNSLRAGSYTLCVRMLNDDGTFGEEEAELDITIRPPLWRSRWAFLLYMLIVAAVALLWRRWFLRRQQRYMMVAEKRRDLEKEQWLNQMRVQLHHEYEDNDAAAGSHEAERKAPVVADRHVADLVSFLHDYCKEYVSPVDGKSCKVNFLSTIPTLEIDFDKQLLREALSILFRNSIDFCPHQCVISVGVARKEDGDAQIQVADNGIGIKDEYKEHAFMPFADGKGIGLSRVHDIIVAHEGDITIKDNPGGGTIFVITLPLKSSNVQEAVVVDNV